MSKSAHNESMGSYVVGFILSLVCTFIPYQLVVNKTLTGNNLLGMIVGFAALQVLIQVFFFLHLGRGPKPLYNVAFFGATVAAILLVIGGSLFIMSHLHYSMASTDVAKQLAESEAIAQVEGNATGACQQPKANHKVILLHSSMNPLRVEAQHCDTLSFVNQDTVAHTVIFGTYTKQGTYAGQSGFTIRKGLSETITLNQAGTYSFYDQLYPSLPGSFTVTTQ